MTGVNYNFGAIQFGQPGDKVTPADFDGDGKTDIGVFRPATGNWWYRKSTDGLQYSIHWGQNGDTPLAADYNGDGKADVAAVRNYVWWIANITNGQTLQSIAFGQAGDKLLVGDLDGDGKTRPGGLSSFGRQLVLRGERQRLRHFGLSLGNSRGYTGAG